MDIIKNGILNDDFSLPTIHQLVILVICQKIDLSFISLKPSFTPFYRVILSNIGDNQKISKVFSPTNHEKHPIITNTTIQHIILS